MHAKGFNTHSVRFYQTDRTEDTKGLTALGESPFRRAAATYPRRFRLHGRMIYHDMQRILTCVQSLCDIEGEYCATNQFLGILRIVKGNSGVCAYALKLQEVSFAFLWLGDESLLVDGATMQITVTQLAIAIVVVEVVRDGDTRWRSIGNSGSCPAFVKTRNRTTSFAF